MHFITLISDWGDSDFYLPAVKGKIYHYLPDATIVDISHHIPLFDQGKAAYVLRYAYPSFPAGTVHLIGVNAVASPNTPHVMVYHRGHYFVGADNGIFSLLFDEEPEKVYEIDVFQDSDYFTFPCRDVFVKVACALSTGTPMEELGTLSAIKNKPTRRSAARKFFYDKENKLESAIINGVVAYIDHYGNAVVNIDQVLFDEFMAQFQRFVIEFGKYKITKLVQAYQDVPLAEKLALFGSNGLLQIAQNQGNAKQMLGLDVDSYVNISFFDPK